MEIVNSVRFLFTNVILAVLGGVFKDNLRTSARLLGVEPATLLRVNPFAALVPWILIQARHEYHPVLDNSRSIVVAVLYFHKRKKAWVPDNYRLTWLADEHGLPISISSISISNRVGEDVVPNIVLGYTTEKSQGSTNERRAYFEALIWRFFFSGGNLANLPESERALAKKLTHTDENHSDVELVAGFTFKREFAIGENVQRLLDEKCAPQSREAQLEGEKRELERALVEQSRKMDALLQMLSSGSIDPAVIAALQSS